MHMCSLSLSFSRSLHEDTWTDTHIDMADLQLLFATALYLHLSLSLYISTYTHIDITSLPNPSLSPIHVRSLSLPLSLSRFPSTNIWKNLQIDIASLLVLLPLPYISILSLSFSPSLHEYIWRDTHIEMADLPLLFAAALPLYSLSLWTYEHTLTSTLLIYSVLLSLRTKMLVLPLSIYEYEHTLTSTSPVCQYASPLPGISWLGTPSAHCTLSRVLGARISCCHKRVRTVYIMFTCMSKYIYICL